jgi:hypothetical protein
MISLNLEIRINLILYYFLRNTLTMKKYVFNHDAH